MPELTATPESVEGPGGAGAPSLGRSPVTSAVLTFLGVVASFVLAGAVAGWIWWLWFTPLRGTVFRHRFVLADKQGYYRVLELQQSFAPTAHYVELAFGFSLVLAAVLALVAHRQALVTFAGVVVGAALASQVMALLGGWLGPPDPRTLALSAADRTSLTSALQVSGWTPYTAWGIGAVLAVLVVYVAFPEGPPWSRRAPRDDARR